MSDQVVVVENGETKLVNRAWVEFWRRVGANPRGLREADIVKEKP